MCVHVCVKSMVREEGGKKKIYLSIYLLGWRRKMKELGAGAERK